MGEYEDRYPDAYGRGDAVARPATEARPTIEERRPVDAAAGPTLSRLVRRPEHILDDVCSRLAASAVLDPTGIEVSVGGSEVTLVGMVASPIAVGQAQAIAAAVPGVARVINQLEVRRPSSDGDWARSGLIEPTPPLIRRVGS